MRGTRTLGLLPLVLAACTFVGAEKVQEIKDQIDADADGVAFDLDCDDFDPRRFPVDPPGEGDPPSDIPYDHIDNDCGGQGDTLQLDLVDVDGDGFPGVDFAEYAAAHREMFGLADDAEVPWPLDVSTTQVDCVDMDTPATLAAGIPAASIHPDVFADAPYDGIDQDCQRDNDFDQDGDGQMPPTIDGVETRPLVQAFVDSTGININLDALGAFGDCDDLNDTIYLATGAANDPVDVAYDGFDSDCDGSNDFDQDGDGYYPAIYVAQFATFVATYHPDDVPAGPIQWGPAPTVPAQSGDCLDQPHPAASLASVDPGTVYPGAAEVFYDGVDSDCGIDPLGNALANNNDFDQDGDGYIPTEYLLDFDTFKTNWSGAQPGYPTTVSPSIEGRGGDCNDGDPIAAPGNFEYLFDDADADCDENINATPFGFASYAWEDPTWPRVVRTNTHYVVGTSAPWGDIVLLKRQNMAMALLFGLDAEYDAEPLSRVPWNNSSSLQNNIHGRGLDLLSVGDRFWLASSYKYPTPVADLDRILLKEYVPDLNGGYTATTVQEYYEWFGYDMDIDLQYVPNNTVDGENGNTSASPAIWTMACGGAGRDVPDLEPNGTPGSVRSLGLEVPLVAQPERIFSNEQETVPSNGTVCFQKVADDGTTADITTCDNTGCRTYISDTSTGSITLAPTQPYQNRILREANYHEGLIILINEGGGMSVVDTDGGIYELLPNEDVVSGDAMYRDGVLYAVAIVERPGNANEILFGWTASPATSPLVTVSMPMFDFDTRFEHEPQGGCDPTVIGCVTGRNLDPYRASLWVDHDLDPSDDKVVIVVAAHSVDVPTQPVDITPLPQDAIGWAFLGFNGTPPTSLP